MLTPSLNPTLTILAAVVLAITAPAQLTFGPGVPLAAPVRPADAAIGDFNGDGLADLAVTTDAPDKISLYFNAGGGTFGAPVNVLVGAGTGADGLVATDLDGDGDTDLAVALHNIGAVMPLLNLGGGTFQLGATTAVGLDPRSVESADLNGDGFPDLVTSNRDGNDVSVLLNSGAGTFPVATSTAVGLDPRGLALADFDADGTIDVAVANHDSRTISVLTNDGAGALSAILTLSVGAQLRPEGLDAADLNGDGLADLVAATSGNGLSFASVFLKTFGGGFGGFAGPTNYAVAGINPSDVVAADFTSSGLPDLVTADQDSNGISALASTGAGTFGAPTGLPTGLRPERLTAGDLDGSGTTDVVVVCRDSNEVYVFLNGGSPPMNPTYPGSGEDFVMRTAVGIGALTTGPGQDVKTIAGGSLLVVQFESPGGTFDFFPPVLVAQQFATGTPPVNPPGFPEVHVDPLGTPAPVILIDGTLPTGFGFSEIVLPGGNVHGYMIPAGLAGSSIMFQSLVLANISSNGIFAAADAHEIQVM